MKGKALLLIYFLSKIDQNILFHCCDNKFCSILGRLINKEKDSLLIQISNLVIKQIKETILFVVREIEEVSTKVSLFLFL